MRRAGTSADLTHDLAEGALGVDSPLADHDAVSQFDALVETDRVEHERRSRNEFSAECRPKTPRQAAGRSRHLEPARIAGQLTGERLETVREAPDHEGIGALLRPIDLGALLPRRSYVAEHAELGATKPPGITDARIAPAPPSTVAEPPAAIRTCRAPAAIAAQISSPTP